MQARRALILFAIVLGFAALAASVAPPPEQQGEGTDTQPAPPPPPESPPPATGSAGELRFVTGGEEPERRSLEAGRQAVVTVAVEEPGQVAIPGLGLLQSAGPGTPARFDVRPTRPGRYEITFESVEGEEERVGVIEVEA